MFNNYNNIVIKLVVKIWVLLLLLNNNKWIISF